MNALAEACIDVLDPEFFTLEAAFLNQLSLARALSNAQYLSLYGWFVQGFYYAAKLKDPLPMFCKLRALRLGSLCDYCCGARWDIVLLLIIHRAPLLEELVFIESFFGRELPLSPPCDFHVQDSSDAAALEAASWGLTQTTPSCCESHLKRIWIHKWRGRDQELKMMSFLLGKASVLKELVISVAKGPGEILIDAPKLIQFKNALREIPRASNLCSIIYSDAEPVYSNLVTPTPRWR